MPFALLVLGIIVGGMCMLLGLNTAAAANEVGRHDLAAQDEGVAAQLVQLQNDARASAAPANLAAAAAALGMVPAGDPAFLMIGSDGEVTVRGVPAAARAVPVAVPQPIKSATQSDKKAALKKAAEKAAKKAAEKKAALKKAAEKAAAQKKAAMKKKAGSATKSAKPKTAKQKAAEKAATMKAAKEKAAKKAAAKKRAAAKAKKKQPNPAPTATTTLPGGER